MLVDSSCERQSVLNADGSSVLACACDCRALPIRHKHTLPLRTFGARVSLSSSGIQHNAHHRS